MEASSVTSSELIVARWNNLQIANGAFPAWHVLLIQLKDCLHYKIVGREDRVHAQGGVPAPSGFTTHEWLEYVQECQPVVEENLGIAFSKPFITWEHAPCEIRLVKGITVLFWQIYDTQHDTLTYLPLKYTVPSSLCSPPSKGLISQLSRRITNYSLLREWIPHFHFVRFIEDSKATKLHQDIKATQSHSLKCSYQLSINTSNEVQLRFKNSDPQDCASIAKEFPHTSLSGFIECSPPTFFINGDGRTLKIVISVHPYRDFEHPTYALSSWGRFEQDCLDFTLTFTPRFSFYNYASVNYEGTGLAKLKFDKEGEIGIQLTRDVITGRMAHLLAAPQLLIEIEPTFYPSLFNEKCKVTFYEWAVTLCVHGGPFGNHALVVVEGICDEDICRELPGASDYHSGEFFRLFFDFTGTRIRLCFTDEIEYDERSPIMLTHFEKVKNMLFHVKKASTPDFSFFGKDSSLGGGKHNCFTFAKAMMEKSDIELGKTFLSYIINLPKEFTHPPEYYKDHPEEF